MAGGNPCTCNGKRTLQWRKKHWYVVVRNGNYSYFESPAGYFHPSAYSLVSCRFCLGIFRTKARYVSELQDGSVEEKGGEDK